MEYTQDQREIVDFLKLQLSPEGSNIVISGAGGTGKAIPDDTILPTPQGWRRADEIKVGDYLFNRHGKKTKVIGVFPQGALDAYRLTFSDYRTAICSQDHLWAVFDEDGGLTTKTLADFINGYLETGFYLDKFPSNACLDWEDLPSQPDPRYHSKRHWRDKERIDPPYMCSPRKNRIDYLGGLFDMNGDYYHTGLRLRVRYRTFIEDVQRMAWSLGYRTGKPIFEKTRGLWTVVIYPPDEDLEDLVKDSKKVMFVTKRPPTNVDFRYIELVKIEEYGKKLMRCFKVDDPEEVFLTESCIPTHNTSMLCNFIVDLIDEGYSVAVTAMTGKATAVLRNKVYTTLKEKEMSIPPRGQLTIETVTKLTKISRPVGSSIDGKPQFLNIWREPSEFPYDVLFVDELSMVPHHISQWWLRTNARVFGFGDYCQLPEVITLDTRSEAKELYAKLGAPNQRMIEGYGVKVLKDKAKMTLHKVLRSDNEIAHLCADLRNFMMKDKEIVNTIKGWAAKTPNISYSTSLDDLEKGDDWQIISYTNKLCRVINNQLCKGGDYPVLGDKIILFDNIRPLELYNGDVLTLESFLNKISEYNKREGAAPLFVCMQWQNRMPRKDGNPLEQMFAKIYESYLRENDLKYLHRLQSLEEAIKICDEGSEESRGEMLKVLDEFPLTGRHERDFVQIFDAMQKIDNGMAARVLQLLPRSAEMYLISADYGYAITTHRSQGSEFPKVCYLLEKFDRPLLYTGISRAKEQVKVINLTKEV